LPASQIPTPPATATQYAFIYDRDATVVGFVGDPEKLTHPLDAIIGKRPTAIAGPAMAPLEQAIHAAFETMQLQTVRVTLEGIPRVVTVVPVAGIIAVGVARWSHPAIEDVARFVLAAEAIDPSTLVQEGWNALTARQREVLRLLSQGLSVKEVGYRLGLHRRTVEEHRRAALRRVGVSSLAELLRFVVLRAVPLLLAFA
jgi:DNA-binding CsgD family transcriptional regulator